MIINEKEYDEKVTTSVYNLGTRMDPFFRKWINMRATHPKFKQCITSKDIFKKVFGKQQRCVDYTHRNWVWTFTNESGSATVWALVSVRGTAWECNKNSVKKDVVPLMLEIIDHINNYEEEEDE